MGSPSKSTPLIAQYWRVKQKVPDAILLFRLGDFYEMFFDDAELASSVLDIQLTSRSKDGAPLCGVPHHAAQPYIAKLLKAGYKVALCEQAAEQPGSRGLLARHLVRVITPGTVDEELVLSADEKSFLLAVHRTDSGFALAAVDVSTGEMRAARVGDVRELREETARLKPREILISHNDQALEKTMRSVQCALTPIEERLFDPVQARSTLSRRFDAMEPLADSALEVPIGAAIAYLEATFGPELAHLRPPEVYHIKRYMLVDETSRRHLELTVSTDGTKAGSLLGVLDQSLTPMGARTLSDWVTYPLLDLEAIAQRLDAVEELVSCDLGGPAHTAMRAVGDLERTISRVGSLRAGPRDLVKLAQSLSAVDQLKRALDAYRCAALRAIAARLRPKLELVALIARALAEEAPLSAREGGFIRPGFDPRVDELRALAHDARGVIARLEARERERTGISSLKVRYNRVFGYYIEVTRAHLERVPADYARKQTLAGAERFITPELKDLEGKILGAEAGLKQLELELFNALVRELVPHVRELLDTAQAIGEFDALLSLAVVARKRGYVRPQLDRELGLSLRDARHPVLETMMRSGDFVPNDLDLDPNERQVLLITGPNMAGKSTYLRQVALIVIMAQMGSFVPAAQARVGVIDRIATRIGARDDLRGGESTFMVEMRETAHLLDGLTKRSLLLLDEVGRGTSTYDGLAIAWALAEHLHDSTRAMVLFATHFHELTGLCRTLARVRNLRAEVREWNGEVIFLRRIVAGAADRSYGLEVARLAGLPQSLLARAREILDNLEQGELAGLGVGALARRPTPGGGSEQMSLFRPPATWLTDELRLLDVERLTPVEALNILARWVERGRRESARGSGSGA